MGKREFLTQEVVGVVHGKQQARALGPKRALGAAVAVVALAACGSTVQVRSTSSAGANDGLGFTTTSGGIVQDTTGGITTQDPGATTGVTTPRTDGSTTGTTVRSGSGGTQAPQPSATSAAPSVGTASQAPIRVGVVYTPGVDKAAAAIGINGLSTGATQLQAQAVTDWINAHGGLGGHKISLFRYAITGSEGSQDAAYEAACTKMTQDYKVRYVVTILTMRPVFMQCLQKANVGLLNDETSLSDKTMQKYAHLLGNPGEFANGRMVSEEVDDLWKRGWLTPKTKVGILSLDSSDGREIVTGKLTAALKRHGLTAANTQYINTSGGDGGSSASSSAALQFRSAGVDRVLSVLTSPLYLMIAASSQGYTPAYAVDSSLGPGALLETAAPKDQLTNSAGIGWQPFLDIGAGTKPGPVSSRQTLCFQIMKSAGQASTAATAQGFQLQVCNVLFYLQDLSNLSPSVPRDLFTTARPLLGKKFVSADTFRVDVTNRTDGAAGYRSLLYMKNCSCYQYVSPVQATS